MKEGINALFEKGFTLIPVQYKEKNPLVSNWQMRTVNDNNPGEFNGQVNVGVVLGAASGNIIDIDLDDPVARELASKFLPETGMIFGRASSPSSHYLYRIDGETGPTKRLQSKLTSRPILEYRSDKGQTVVPPSVHKSGEQIKWVRFDEAGIVRRDDLMTRLGWLAVAVVLERRYETGKRQDIVLAFAGFLLTAGKSGDDILQVVEAVCDHTGDESTAQRIDAVNRTAEKHRAGEAITQGAKLEELIGSDAVSDIRKFLDIPTRQDPKALVSKSSVGQIDGSDTAVGKLFATECADRIMYVEEMQTYFTYEDGLWHRDGQSLVAAKLFDEFIQQQIADAAKIPDGTTSNHKVSKWIKFRNRSSAQSALMQARSYLRQPMGLLDKNDLLFACRNGVVDLKRREFLEHSPNHYITARSEISFDPEAGCPKFKKFLDQTFCGDDELIAYVQGLMGYWLTGRTDRQEFYVLHGEGANGKSTLLSIVSHILGPYVRSIMAETLFEQKYSSTASMADLATLQGKRLAIAQEAESDVRINSSLIKQLTGQDTIKVKLLYGNPYEIDPKFKIVLVANVRPSLNVQDKALVRRVKLIPFEHTVDKKDRNPKLLEELKAEASGILNLLIEGAQAYLSGGIIEPVAVTAATSDYISAFDSVQGFLNEMVVKEPGQKISKSDLFQAYKAYCEDNGDVPLSQKLFGGAIGKSFNEIRTWKGRSWSGLRLSVGDEKARKVLESFRSSKNVTPLPV